MNQHGYVTVILLVVLVIFALFALAQCDVSYTTSRASAELPTAVPSLLKNLK